MTNNGVPDWMKRVAREETKAAHLALRDHPELRTASQQMLLIVNFRTWRLAMKLLNSPSYGDYTVRIKR